MSWTNLDLLYRFGRRIGWDDYPDIRLVVAQWTLLWQLVKFGRCSQTSPGTTFTFALAFDKESDDRKILNGNNLATPRTNLVNFRPIISDFTLLERAFFFRDPPAIIRRSSLVTLAFRNGLEDRNFDFSREIGNHFCKICGEIRSSDARV